MRCGSLTERRLTGKIALVTGGGQGLGYAMALGFAEAGADLVIASRKIAKCQEAAGAITSLTGRRVLPVACNVGSWSEVDALVETVYEQLGRIDVLVNNAGMSPLYERLDAVSEDLYDKTMGVNLKGPFRLSALVGSRMADGDGGSIINVSSRAAVSPKAHIVPYAAAKAGLNAITVGFAHALGPKVRVNCIMAGAFRTDVTKAWDMAAFDERAQKQFALERIGEPKEVVGAALYFASDAASFTTGAILAIDGGW